MRREAHVRFLGGSPPQGGPLPDRARFAFRTLFSAPETPQLTVASAGCGVLELLATSEV
jgi:hypothetical protein